MAGLNNVRRIDEILRDIAALKKIGLVGIDWRGDKRLNSGSKNLEEILLDVFCSEIGR